MKLKFASMSLFVVVLFIIDQLTKHVFYDLQIGKSFGLIEPILNTGISYGIQINYFLILVVSVLVFFFMIRQVYKGYVSFFVACVFLAGLLGNFFDRLFFDGVRDFFVFFDLFIFNVADVYLTGAIIWFILEEYGYVGKLGGIFSGKLNK